jgi:tRNA(fMet)-specific endonuclease VapC
MLVLDTSILTHIQHGSGVLFDRIGERLASTVEPVYASIVSLEEQLRGRLSVCHRADTPEKYVEAAAFPRQTFEFYPGMALLDFDGRAAAEFRRLKTARIRISTMDLRIAAIVMANDATLVTRNLSDFRTVPRRRAEDWTTA